MAMHLKDINPWQMQLFGNSGKEQCRVLAVLPFLPSSQSQSSALCVLVSHRLVHTSCIWARSQLLSGYITVLVCINPD